jgi:hypothetical protein
VSPNSLFITKAQKMERAAQALAPREHEKVRLILFLISWLRIFVFS